MRRNCSCAGSHLYLLSTQELRVRKAASKSFEDFEAKLQEEFNKMVQSLHEERDEKMGEVAAFRR